MKKTDLWDTCHTCDWNKCYQQGGGWTERDFVVCSKLGVRVYTDPPIADRSKITPRMLVPGECPKKQKQLTLF